MDWDEYFILEAYVAALKSKDPRTQVGACLVGPDREVRSKGYNGLCRGEDDLDPANHVAPRKHLVYEHAERNCLWNLARIGVSGKGCALYCTLHPCIECAKGIVQVGIVEVVLHAGLPGAQVLSESQREAAALLARRGIGVRWWSGVPAIPGIRFDGRQHMFAPPR